MYNHHQLRQSFYFPSFVQPEHLRLARLPPEPHLERIREAEEEYWRIPIGTGRRNQTHLELIQFGQVGTDLELHGTEHRTAGNVEANLDS